MNQVLITLTAAAIVFTSLAVKITETVPATIIKEAGNETASTKDGNSNSSQKHLEELKNWPKVFILNPDPHYPVVCYAGVSFNASFAANNETSDGKTSGSAGEKNKTATEQAERNTTDPIFSLSSDPDYPVTCRVGHIPANLTDGTFDYGTVDEEEDGGNSTNITCIRRDYENNVSAIFLFKTGPIQLAWNVFDRSVLYGFMTVMDIENIGTIKLLNETVVDCGEYGFITDDKASPGVLSDGCAASLCG